MEAFELHELLDESKTLVCKSWLYNSHSFLKTNNDLPKKHLYLFNKANDQYEAHLVVSVEGEAAMSPVKAPFGGIEWYENISSSALKWFLNGVENFLESEGVKELRVHQAPENYQRQDLVNELFLESGYDLIQERVYQGIDITDTPLSEQMADMQKRRIKKCQKAGFIFKKYTKNELSRAFEQIDRWRNAASKGLSMTWADLHNSSKRNPKAYMAFGVLNEDLMIAGSIVVDVGDGVLYNFFPASYDAYNSYSPMVMLVDGIYDWGRLNGYRHLDLGTSYVHKNVNTSLKLFKERLGAKTYHSWSWRKKLN